MARVEKEKLCLDTFLAKFLQTLGVHACVVVNNPRANIFCETFQIASTNKKHFGTYAYLSHRNIRRAEKKTLTTSHHHRCRWMSQQEVFFHLLFFFFFISL